MRGFIRTLTIFVYFFLALFVQSSSVLACENLTQNIPSQYISASKPETTLINNKKEEYYVISRNNSRSEITNPSNKNNNFGFNSFDKTNIDYNIAVRHAVDNAIYPIRISHSISPNLKNAIYTRAP